MSTYRDKALYSGSGAIRQGDDRIVGVHTDDGDGAVLVVDGLHHGLLELGGLRVDPPSAVLAH